MAKPRQLADVQVREIAAALGATEVLHLQRRQIGDKWKVVGYEYELVLSDDQVTRLCEFLSEMHGESASALRVVIDNGP